MKRRQPSDKLYLSPRTTRMDIKAVGLGRAGLTMKTIARETGLSEHQVALRLKHAGVSTMDYRRGESELARKIISLVHDDSKVFFDTMVSNVRRYLKD